MKPTTHPIGPGTVNLSVNMLREIRLWLGRLAFRFDVSTGAVVRAMIAKARDVWAAAHLADASADADGDALVMMDRAQEPTSPGGVNTTPEEMADIRERVAQSRALDRQLAARLDMAQAIERARKHRPLAA
jgi:hypothetical protein